MTNIALAYSPITVDDVDAAIPFYRDGLGLEVVNDVSYDGHRWVSFGFPGQGSVVVVSDPTAGRSPEDGEALNRLIVKGSAPYRTSSRPATLTPPSSSCAPSAPRCCRSPRSRAGDRAHCAFRDPAGNDIRINQV